MEDDYLVGETVLRQTKKLEWLNDLASSDDKENQALLIDDEISLKLKRRVPFYKYFINFLLYKFSKDLNIERRKIRKVRKELFESIEKSEKNPILNDLAKVIIKSFEDKGILGDNSHFTIWDFSSFNDNKNTFNESSILNDLRIEKIDRDRIILYAYGLGMDLDELETFLMKVLGLAGLNIWDRKEGLTYIALRHFPEDSIYFYVRANELYDKVTFKDKKKDIPRIQNFNTISLQNNINGYILAYKNMKNLDDDIISNIVSYHSQVVDQNRTRTIELEFTDTFTDIMGRLENIVNKKIDPSSTIYERLNKEDKFFAKALVKISYLSNDDLEIGPENTLIWQEKPSGRKLQFYPDRNYLFNKTDKENTYDLTAISDYYKDENNVPLLESKNDDYKLDFISPIEGVKNAELEKTYLTDLKTFLLLSYIYAEDDFKKDYDKLDNKDQFEILNDILKDSYIDIDIISQIIIDGDLSQINRARLITILFLDYFLVNENKWSTNLQYPSKRKRDYMVYMDNKLRNCGLYEYNISNPYEEILLEFIVSDQPLDAFKELWAKYSLSKKDWD